MSPSLIPPPPPPPQIVMQNLTNTPVRPPRANLQYSSQSQYFSTIRGSTSAQWTGFTSSASQTDPPSPQIRSKQRPTIGGVRATRELRQ